MLINEDAYLQCNALLQAPFIVLLSLVLSNSCMCQRNVTETSEVSISFLTSVHLVLIKTLTILAVLERKSPFIFCFVTRHIFTRRSLLIQSEVEFLL